MNSKIIPPIYFIILFLLAIVSNYVFPIIKIVKVPYTYSGFKTNYAWIHDGFVGRFFTQKKKNSNNAI